MKNLLTIIMFVLVAVSANAQNKKLKVAIFPPEGDVEVKIKNTVFDAIEEVFTYPSSTYTPVSRNDLEKVVKEQLGNEDPNTVISDSSRSNMGKLAGADIICTSRIDNRGNNKFSVRVSLLDLEGKLMRARSLDIENEKLYIECRNLAKKMASDGEIPPTINFYADGKCKDAEIITFYGQRIEYFQTDYWFTCRKDIKNNDVVLQVTCKPNNSINSRYSDITVEVDARSYKIRIEQDALSKEEWISQRNVNFNANGGSIDIIINVNEMPEITPPPANWLKVTQNDKRITIVCDDNKGGNIRNEEVKLYFRNNTDLVEIEIHQEAGEIMNPKNDKLELSASGEEKDVDIYAKDYKVSSQENNGKDRWLSWNKTTTGLRLKAKKNKSNDVRTGYVNIDANGRTAKITITQAGKAPTHPFALKSTKIFGLSAGYVQRGWNLFYDRNEEFALWEQPDAINGVQAGVKFNWFFKDSKHGFGIYLGLYGEYYNVNNKTAIDPDNRKYSYNLKKYVAYVPLHLSYRFDFSETVGILFFGGAGLDFDILENVKATYTGETEPFYKSPDKSVFKSALNRYNVSGEFGGGILLMKCAMVSATFSQRLFNPEEKFSDKQKKSIMVSFTWWLFNKKKKSA